MNDLYVVVHYATYSDDWGGKKDEITDILSHPPMPFAEAVSLVERYNGLRAHPQDHYYAVYEVTSPPTT